ncbi:hypothetical protein QFZ71_002863 [Streptomyces sp. V2I9]|nr:hypothetical protein [Streptomyces sp. V2I9]
MANASLPVLTSWPAGAPGLSFHVEGSWTAVLGGLVISAVS